MKGREGSMSQGACDMLKGMVRKPAVNKLREEVTPLRMGGREGEHRSDWHGAQKGNQGGGKDFGNNFIKTHLP